MARLLFIDMCSDANYSAVCTAFMQRFMAMMTDSSPNGRVCKICSSVIRGFWQDVLPDGCGSAPFDSRHGRVPDVRCVFVEGAFAVGPRAVRESGASARQDVLSFFFLYQQRATLYWLRYARGMHAGDTMLIHT